jgi:hypothetical protein
MSAMGVVLATVYRSSYTLLRTNEMQYNVETTSRTKERFAFALDTIYKTAKVLQENTEVYEILKKGSDIPEAQIVE